MSRDKFTVNRNTVTQHEIFLVEPKRNVLDPVYCDQCETLIGYQGSQPRPYMICQTCFEAQQDLGQQDREVEAGKP